MEIRKLSYVLAFALAASIGAFACAEDDEEPNDNAACKTDEDCAGDLVCTDGQCVCPEGLTACGTACVDTNTDVAHCGACDNACEEGQVCDEGECKIVAPGCTTDEDCEEGLVCREGECVEPEPECTTNEDCADRGANFVCSEEGTCVCAEGFTLCGDACVDTNTDVAHCGACDNACDEGQTCVDGACADA